VADEREDKPDADAPAEAATSESSQETAVGHSVIEEPARETAVGHPVVESDSAAQPAAPKDEPATEVFFSSETPAPQPAAAPPSHGGGTSPAAADRQAADDSDPFSQKPELYIGGAFVGAFVVAKLLKKLTGGGS
jgi:hypothetical protein